MATRVYVGNLPSDVRPREIEDLFYRYYPVRVDPKAGFAFVEVETPRDAEDAVHDMDGVRFDGRRLTVQFAKADRRDLPRGAPVGASGLGLRRSEFRLEVSNLAERTSWQGLKDFAREAGQCTYANVEVASSGKRIGVIEYSNMEDMKRAIKILDDTKLEGNYVRVEEFGKPSLPAGPRGASRSRSRSPVPHGRSRSRTPPRYNDSPVKGRGRSPSPRDRSRERSRSRSNSPRKHSRSVTPDRR